MDFLAGGKRRDFHEFKAPNLRLEGEKIVLSGRPTILDSCGSDLRSEDASRSLWSFIAFAALVSNFNSFLLYSFCLKLL